MAHLSSSQDTQPLLSTSHLRNRPVEALPSYSENPVYEASAPPQHVTRQAVKKHERRVQADLKRQAKDRVACDRLRPHVPLIYRQLTAAAQKGPSPSRHEDGPAALRPAHLREPPGVNISFTMRNVNQEMLRRHLPALLVEYAQEQERLARASEGPPPLVHAQTAPASVQTTSRCQAYGSTLERSATSLGLPSLDADKLRVEALFFDNYTQKIYFSKRFIGLFHKDEEGERHIGLGLAFVVFGVKLGLPLLDVLTWTAFDLPRLALQGITGKQKLRMRL